MAYKDAFLNSLSDEQLGIFYAYEYNDNLDDILQDYITHVQYSLFMEWKNNEAVAPIENAAATNNADSAKLDNLLSVVNNLTTMLGGLCERMDSIESNQQEVIEKIVALELNQKNQTEQDISSLKQHLEENISTLELNQKNQTDKLSLNLKQHIAETTEGVLKIQQDVIGKIATLELDQKKQTKQICLDISNLKQHLEENKEEVMKNHQDLIGEIAVLESEQKKQLSLDISNLKQQLEENQEDVMQAALRPLEYKTQVKEYLKRMLSQMKDSSVRKEMKEETCNMDIIKKILKDMKKFKGDEELENNSTEIVLVLSCVSDKARMNIIESGILEYMNELFVIYWPSQNKREYILTNIFIVFYHISCVPSARKHLLKDSFVELFMLPFADPNFSKFNIIAGNLLSNLLLVADKDWTVTITKEQVDNLLIENIPKWQLGLLNPFYSTSFEWPLQQIYNGRKSQKTFHSWDMANKLLTKPEKYTELLKKEEQSVKNIEELVANKSTDDEVKKNLQICLDIIRK